MMKQFLAETAVDKEKECKTNQHAKVGPQHGYERSNWDVSLLSILEAFSELKNSIFSLRGKRKKKKGTSYRHCCVL